MRPLTEKMRRALIATQLTFDGDEVIDHCHGGSANGLQARGITIGNNAPLTLTEMGKRVAQEVRNAQEA